MALTVRRGWDTFGDALAIRAGRPLFTRVPRQPGGENESVQDRPPDPPPVIVWLMALVDLVERNLRGAGRIVRHQIIPGAARAARSPRTSRFGRAVMGVAAATAVLLLAAGALARSAATSLLASVAVASPEAVTLPPLEDRSIVLGVDGSPLTVVDGGLNRKIVPLDEVSDPMIDAVIAIEDERFWHHDGVDGKALLRAASRNTRAGGVEQGGSTITQQLVKITLLTPERDLKRKLNEVLLARAVEEHHSKRDILERYLNAVYFGNGAYGVQAAAETYFGKPASALDAGDAALLAGLIQSPSGYDPTREPELARQRRADVLERMVANGHLSSADARDLGGRPLPGAVQPMDTTTNFVVDAVMRELLADDRLGPDPDARKHAVLHGGLEIRSTIHPRLQGLAEAAVREGVPGGYELNGALAAVDPASGGIRAIAGGTSYDRAQFDAATSGARQPGSAFKTFTLVAALEAGHNVADVISGSAPCPIANPGGTPDPWSPDNYEGTAPGSLSLTDATVGSVNCAYARLAERVGWTKIVEVARRMGVTAELAPVPSLTLGTEVVTPLDMASAYATLAADGVARKPHVVAEVRRADGSVLFTNTDPGTAVLDPNIARQTTAVLSQVVERGTGTAAGVPGQAVAGKTGTAQNYKDAWFAGYSKHLAAAVWMGNLHGEVPMRGIRGLDVTGGSFPARIWSVFMRGALEGQPLAPFDAPDPAAFRAPVVLDPPPPTEAPPAHDNDGRDEEKAKSGGKGNGKGDDD